MSGIKQLRHVSYSLNCMLQHAMLSKESELIVLNWILKIYCYSLTINNLVQFKNKIRDKQIFLCVIKNSYKYEIAS